MADSYRMLTVIVPRGKGDAVVEFLRSKRVNMTVVVMGKGTATNEIADIMGLGDAKKDVVFACLESVNAPKILDALGKKFKLNEKGRGVAFTVNLTSLGSGRLLNYFSQKEQR